LRCLMDPGRVGTLWVKSKPQLEFIEDFDLEEALQDPSVSRPRDLNPEEPLVLVR